MGYKRPTQTTESALINSALPQHGNTYTVISHESIIKTVRRLLEANDLSIINVTYISNYKAQVAQAFYHVKPNDYELSDANLNMMFTWTNSYDKTVRFQCSLGAVTKRTKNHIVTNNISFARKHTGSADEEMESQIENQIKFSKMYFDKVVRLKKALIKIQLSEKERSEILGRLYFNEDILETNQLTVLKKYVQEGYENYPTSNAWVFYNSIVNAMKTTHPRNWLKDNSNLNRFFSDNVIKEDVVENVKNSETETSPVNESEATEEEVVDLLYGVSDDNEVISKPSFDNLNVEEDDSIEEDELVEEFIENLYSYVDEHTDEITEIKEEMEEEMNFLDDEEDEDYILFT